MTSTIARLVLSAVGVAFLLATPAEAAKSKSRNKAVAGQVHGKKHVRAKHRGAVRHDPYTVTFGNNVLGRDPDPNIRHQLRRDLSGFFGGDI